MPQDLLHLPHLSDREAAAKALTRHKGQVEALRRMPTRDLEALRDFVDHGDGPGIAQPGPAGTQPLLREMGKLLTPHDPGALRRVAREGLLALHPDKIGDTSLVASGKAALAFQVLKRISDLSSENTRPQAEAGAEVNGAEVDDLFMSFFGKMVGEIERERALKPELAPSRREAATRWSKEVEALIFKAPISVPLRNAFLEAHVRDYNSFAKAFERSGRVSSTSSGTNFERLPKDLLAASRKHWYSRHKSDTTQFCCASTLARVMDAKADVLDSLSKVLVTHEQMESRQDRLVEELGVAHLLFGERDIADELSRSRESGAGLNTALSASERGKVDKVVRGAIKNVTQLLLLSPEQREHLGITGMRRTPGDIIEVISFFLAEPLQKLMQLVDDEAARSAIRHAAMAHLKQFTSRAEDTRSRLRFAADIDLEGHGQL